MEKTDRLMLWAREIEFRIAGAISRLEPAVAELEGGTPPEVIGFAADVIEKLVDCRSHLNTLILVIGDCQKGRK